MVRIAPQFLLLFFFFFSIEVQRLWLMAFSFAKLFRVVTPLCVFDGNSTPGRQV